MMMTFGQLTSFHRSLSDEKVLSIYIDGSAADPAVQRAWRTQLDNSIKDLRLWLDGSTHEERESFEKAIVALEQILSSVKTTFGSPGWVAFITEDGVIDRHELPVPVPTLAVWSTGPAIAPYVGALKEAHPVIVVVADASKSEIFRYRGGVVEHVDTVRSHHVIEPASHMSSPPKQGFHTGTRGTAGRDSAQRSLLAGRDRMIDQVVDRAAALAGKDSFIVVGGIDRVAKKIVNLMISVAEDRALLSDGLDVHATEAQIAEAARRSASYLRTAHDNRRLTEIAENAGAGGLGVLGPIDTRVALEKAAVRDLYLTHRYLENHAAEAESAVRAALAQHATVEEVSDSAADRLERVGGMAAGLRFRSGDTEAGW